MVLVPALNVVGVVCAFTMPQHFMTPLVRSTHTDLEPATICWMGPPTLVVMGERRLTVVPSPNWPLLFSPQHLTAPLELVGTAQVKYAVGLETIKSKLPDSALMLWPSGLPCHGGGFVLPAPSCPSVFRPQQYTPPKSGRIAHACLWPIVRPSTCPTRTMLGYRWLP